MVIGTPRADVFKNKGIIKETIIAPGTLFYIAERIEYPEEKDGGGIYVHYRGMPFPRKGLPTPEGTKANDIMKRIIRFFVTSFSGKEMVLPMLGFAVLPYSRKIKTIERMLIAYTRISDWVLNDAFMTTMRYSRPSREMGSFMYEFLLALGIDKDNYAMKGERKYGDEGIWVTIKGYSDRCAWLMGEVIAAIVEYDDAYRYRIQDIMTEASKEEFLKNPRKEFLRLMDIFMSREQIPVVKDWVKKASRILSIALLHPKIKKAFKEAVQTADFKRMMLDNADRYHVLIRGDYDFTGRTFDERVMIYKEVHMRSKCCSEKIQFTKDKNFNTVAGNCMKCSKSLEPEDVKFEFPPQVEVAPQ